MSYFLDLVDAFEEEQRHHRFLALIYSRKKLLQYVDPSNRPSKKLRRMRRKYPQRFMNIPSIAKQKFIALHLELMVIRHIAEFVA